MSAAQASGSQSLTKPHTHYSSPCVRNLTDQEKATRNMSDRKTRQVEAKMGKE